MAPAVTTGELDGRNFSTGGECSRLGTAPEENSKSDISFNHFSAIYLDDKEIYCSLFKRFSNGYYYHSRYQDRTLPSTGFGPKGC